MAQTLEDFYEASSKGYQSKHSLSLLRKLPGPVQKGWRIVDIGCGTGTNTEALARLVGDDGLVVGVDPISARLDLFKDRVKDFNLKQLAIVHAGAEALDYAPFAPLDLVFSNLVLHWINEDKLRQIFQKVHESLKPGGCFVASFAEVKPDEGDFIYLFLKATPKSVAEKVFQHVNSRRLSWYIELAQEFGFRIVDKGYLYTEVKYNNIKDMADKLTASIERIVDFSDYLSLEMLQTSGMYEFRKNGTFTAVNRCSYFVVQKF